MEKFGIKIIPIKSSFSSYIVLSEESASRTCVFNKANLPNFEIDGKKADAIRSAQVLMVDGNELDNAVKGAKIAKESGTKVLYDAGGFMKALKSFCLIVIF